MWSFGKNIKILLLKMQLILFEKQISIWDIFLGCADASNLLRSFIASF